MGAAVGSLSERRTAERPRSRAALIATPNPLPPDAQTVEILWTTGDIEAAEIRVAVDGGEEQLFARGAGGRARVPWVGFGETYEFRLYRAGDAAEPAASVTVTRRDPEWEAIEQGLRRLAELPQHEERLAELLAEVAAPYARPPLYTRHFRRFEERGSHLTPVHFYQPIPDTRELREELWTAPSELAGVDMNDAVQLELLREALPRFRAEYERFPTKPTDVPYEYYFANEMFGRLDALMLYGMIRHFEPKLVLECGGGTSTKVIATAIRAGAKTRLVTVEPYPDETLKAGFPGLDSFVHERVENLPLEVFDELGAGDVLFIDTSHMVRIGSEVNYLFLEVLPRLAPGVIVHVHDVFFPFEYPRPVIERFEFYNEQYLLQAFLAFNGEFEVLLGARYAAHRFPDEVRACFPNAAPWKGGSFWFRRKERP